MTPCGTCGARPSAGVYRIANPAQQYLMQSGRTLFKGMTFDDLHRLQLDIEVVSRPGMFPHAQRPEDRIVIVALGDNRGWRDIIDARELSEKEMLERLVAAIRRRDPDVIEGHNIYAFDLAYLMTRCALHGVDFAVGRDGSAPRTFASAMRFAERSVDLPAVDIAGRHVIDTYLLVMAFDVFKRDLPGYGLKAAARYFGLQADDRTYVKGEEISQVWRDEPERLIDYAGHDVVETERLARLLSGSAFYLTRMVPMPYGQVARTGPAAKIEALMVRGYLRQRHALPSGGASDTGRHMRGGYVNIFATGRRRSRRLCRCGKPLPVNHAELRRMPGKRRSGSVQGAAGTPDRAAPGHQETHAGGHRAARGRCPGRAAEFI